MLLFNFLRPKNKVGCILTIDSDWSDFFFFAGAVGGMVGDTLYFGISICQNPR